MVDINTPYASHLAVEYSHDVISQGVCISIEETVCVIYYCVVVVFDGECGGGANWRDKSVSVCVCVCVCESVCVSVCV